MRHSGCDGRQRLDPVEGELGLDVQRLLAPERPVVVEDGNALGHGRKSGEPSVVTRCVKSRRALLAAPSFQDGSTAVAENGVGSHFSRTLRAKQKGRLMAGSVLEK